MADLDDFFAKKDRKKSKTTKKFATTDEVAKKLEDTKKIEKPIKKEKIPDTDDVGQEIHEQDEWRDFEEEKKDYTGLKIGNLTLNQDGTDGGGGGSDNNFEQQQTTYDETGNEVERKVGPWKRINSEGATEQAPPKVEEKKVDIPTPNVVGGAYVPPSKRNQPVQNLQPTRLRSRAAPDIHSEEYFPTLSGGSKEQKKGRNEGSFELVSHSKSNSLKYVEQSKHSAQGPKLSLGNRYDTLSNDS